MCTQRQSVLSRCTRGLAAIRKTIPLWVWLIVFGLASIEPLTRVWLEFGLPADQAPTGMRTIVDVSFIHSIRMFDTGFFSPFATCKSALGTHDISYYYCHPNSWYMGAIGYVAHRFFTNDFILLGLINGFNGVVCLLLLYLLLRELAPKQANLAFLLYTLGGGLGGVLYVITGWLGWLTASSLAVPYYTLGFIFFWAAMIALSKAWRSDLHGTHWFGLSAVMMFLGAFGNARFAVPVWGLILVWLYVQEERPLKERIFQGSVLGLSAVLGMCLSMRLS